MSEAPRLPLDEQEISATETADGNSGAVAVHTHPAGANDIAQPIQHPLIHEPGVFLGLPEEEYHSALALSASGIKWLRVSTLDWWARSPLNPSREEEEDSEAREIGRAYHKRIVEGREAFNAIYAPAIDPRDFPNALRTNEELCSAIAEAGGPIKGTKGKRKAELIEMLLSYDDDAPIWDCITEDHAAKHQGKSLLSPRVVERIEIAAAMIERHPQLCKAFTGGQPEVSIFWNDIETGVPCKARLDYLKPRAIVDLKSFQNAIALPIRKAVARAVANYRYHIQAAWYLEAAEQARELIRNGAVSGEIDSNYLTAVRDAPDRTFLFVFQAKGTAPLARGMVLPPSTVLDIGKIEASEAKVLWARCWQTYGPDNPWLDVSDIETFDPTEFPVYIAE